MEFTKTMNMDQRLIKENLMGPNPVKMCEELCSRLDLKPGMRVMDLGCGKGLTSIFLAKEYSLNVYATDLWIGATENWGTIKSQGLEDQIIPIHADAMDLPYAEEFFDAIISVDAYYYFGREKGIMDSKVAKYCKKGGTIALAFPGFRTDVHNPLPPEFLLSWKAEDLDTFQTLSWWKDLLSEEKLIRLESIQEMTCNDECWRDWLESDIDYALNDRKSMNAGAGKYMNMLSVVAKRI